MPAALRGAAVSLLRWRMVRRIALEHTDTIADAVAHAGDATAAAIEVEARTGLWPEEARSLVDRETERQSAETAAAHDHQIASATQASRAALLTALEAAGLTAEEAIAAAAKPRLPAVIAPEDLESTGGPTEVWPPHPIQALTCEPVTAGDYARRARTDQRVTRAWAVPGRLTGIAWNGLRVVTAQQQATMPAAERHRVVVADSAAAAITIVVESAAAATNDQFHREVLLHAMGAKMFRPFGPRPLALDPLDPRRLIADEVGIAPLRRAPVRIEGTLLIPPTANRGAVSAQASARIDAFFAAGRPERYGETPAEDPLSGPWEPAPQPQGGWVPGESVRLSEIVEQLVNVPEVIAVKDLRMRLDTSSAWAAGANGQLAIPAGHVPVRDVAGCLTSEFQVTGGCDA